MTNCTATATTKRAKVENQLTKAERDALVVGGTVRGEPARGVVKLCAKMAGDHARRVLADRGRKFDPEELEGESLAAAVEAAKYFDPDAGTAFTSYVSKWVKTALTQATDERRTPDVRCVLDRRVNAAGTTLADRIADRHDGDDDPEARYAEYGVADLDADQRAAFDLLPPVAHRVVELMIAGHDLTAIKLQLDMPGKDVRLAMRAAVDTLRRVGLVPADADPYPHERERQDAISEASKPGNVRAVREREQKDAARADRAAAKDRLVGLIRGMILNDPGITVNEIARRLSKSHGRVGDLIREHGLRPKREPKTVTASG